jgi:2-oxoglutarate dehydrogenase E1 component
MAEGSFQVVLDEIDDTINPEKVRKIVVCSGKVYYDLLAERRKREITDIAIHPVRTALSFP